ncbi:MAG TPA: Lrp/AsnC family transcriptional regulator [Candidatus Diapherotrites archaeon]|uniref:Lrp/AsnC family transcriptional regulator n=1 Tax=Candidatus Iainarchaeum sp. TaxID=3101447 RepID=A0A7J4J017_9ARCH|nr:Lrp/AsnC family transcriptional regulator [Candidatus Diapherotrites archaeon]
MAVVMKVDDEVRLNILAALLRKGSVIPNIRQLQKYTGYHKATIKSSLDFLYREGLLGGFGPKFDFRQFGYKLEVMTLLQADLTKRPLLEKFIEEAKKDPNLYFISGIVGSGSWNLLCRHIYNDIESYHKGVNDKYFGKLKGIHDLMRSQEIFYVTEPFYKLDSRTGALIEIIRKAKGYS